MPNQPPERDRASREPHARPVRDAAGSRPRERSAGGDAAGRLRARAGVGLSVAVALGLTLALVGFVAQPNRNPDSLAVAGTTTLPTVSPEAPEPTPPPTAAATPAAATPVATPLPTPASPQSAAQPSSSPTVDAKIAKRLQRAVDAFRSKTGIPGISVAIVWDDGREWTGVGGRADIRSKERVTPGTAFAFASVSKTLTAAVVLQLVDEDRVDLDAPAVRYLKDYPLDRRITVRMLLDHRSSLPDFFSNAKIDRALQRDKEAAWTATQTWKYVPKWRPKPGTIYDYSNTNYLLLGELVERVTGNPLAAEVRARLLDPLGLETAWYQAVEEPRAPGATGYRLTRTASGVSLRDITGRSEVMPFRSVVTAAGGAGSIAGTATDAARWMSALGSGEVTSAATYREMIRDARYSKAMRAIVPYGLGVQVLTIEKQRTLGHSGRYLGFQNAVRYLREPGISIAILTNQSTHDPYPLMRRLVRIVAPVKEPAAPASPGASPTP
ncbi:MAG TPA: serine hydrolase domain-containing protein [Candidatus Limnocylindrales bacterium]|nr:serine hydrolase domain-containing protein [Candidatus Limnocylindrales bacterium]